MKTLILLRHASAGDRGRWNGDDFERPLDERGMRQAEGLVQALARYEIERILASAYVRCIQTVEPLGQSLGLEIEERDELAEGASREDALALVDELRGEGAVLCTHGDIVLGLLGRELKKGESAILKP